MWGTYNIYLYYVFVTSHAKMFLTVSIRTAEHTASERIRNRSNLWTDEVHVERLKGCINFWTDKQLRKNFWMDEGWAADKSYFFIVLHTTIYYLHKFYYDTLLIH